MSGQILFAWGPKHEKVKRLIEGIGEAGGPACRSIAPWTCRMVDRLVDVLVDEPASRFVFRLVG